MFARALMVVAVAALGLDVESGNDLGRWARSGTAWCQASLENLGDWLESGAARLTDLRAAEGDEPAMPNGALAFAGSAAAPERSDAAFAAVVGGMVAEFAAPPAPVAVTWEPAPITEDELYSGLAFELNRAAEGLAPIAPPPTPVVLPAPDAGSSVASAEAGRVAVAVRLTGQAIHAWLSLIQLPPVAD